jgi:6,7-dimethyl-8-ribityllumazine synthase
MNEISGNLDGNGRRFAIVLARFNSLVTEQLLSGARDCLLRHGVRSQECCQQRQSHVQKKQTTRVYHSSSFSGSSSP